jgi:arylsulfatase
VQYVKEISQLRAHEICHAMQRSNLKEAAKPISSALDCRKCAKPHCSSVQESYRPARSINSLMTLACLRQEILPLSAISPAKLILYIGLGVCLSMSDPRTKFRAFWNKKTHRRSQLKFANLAGVSAAALLLTQTNIASAQQAISKSVAAGEHNKVADTGPAWPQAPKAPAGAPNIVIVLLDDVGFGAAGTFGGPAQTPALDQLAAQGLRYNRFHVTAMCSPTRASLLSGRNHHRASFGTVAEIGNSSPGYNAFWPKSVVSLPEMLRRNGYSTAAFGKWHNTPLYEISPVGPFDRWPTGLGFEYFYGFQGGETSQWEPVLYRNTTPVEPARLSNDAYHFTSELVDDALRWVHTHQLVAPDKPYFLYMATGATHTPHSVPQAWINKYKGQFDQGWDKLREEIFARQKQLGVIPANAELTPRPRELPAWETLSADQKRLYERQAEVYAGYLAHTDYEVGRMLDDIRKGPNGDNTLIFYLVGDNGASGEGGLDGNEHETTDNTHGISSDIPRQLSHIDKLGGPGLTNNYAVAWAWAMNTPFQWTKQVASHFGGTRDPLIVSWPSRIKDASALRSQFTHVNDIAPTIYGLLGITVPKTIDGIKQEPIDGVSFADSFSDSKAPSLHRVQYFEQLGNRAIYQDGWVAAAFHAVPWEMQAASTDFDQDRWELYNIDQDFSEAHDLSGKYPAKLAQLKKLFDKEAGNNYAFPMVNGISTALKNLYGSRPTVAGNRKEFRYFGTTPRLPTSAIAQLLGSHRITASLEIPAGGASGVIVADGGSEGGFALYIKNGRLVYEQNFAGHERYAIVSTAPLPAGHVDITFEFERQGTERWGGGIGRLSINGMPAGEGMIAHVGRADMMDSFDIGDDRGSPVSETYSSPTKFNGTVNEVRIKLE